MITIGELKEILNHFPDENEAVFIYNDIEVTEELTITSRPIDKYAKLKSIGPFTGEELMNYIEQLENKK